jgi:hypothetical protein
VADDQHPRVWLKAFWGFDPGNEGYLGFTRSGDRDRFIELARPGDLVLIYGADAAETDVDDRRQALGFLEIDTVAISDRERLSADGLKRKLANGWEDRWTFAVPVKRAWRVTRRIEVRHLTPETYIPAAARVIASRGELLTWREAENTLQLPVGPVSVFGEIPIPEDESHEFELRSIFKTTRGINPVFGTRTSDYEDGELFLYMLEMDGDIELLLGRPAGSLMSMAVVKVGFSREPTRRRDEHNAALPPAGRFRWNLKFTSKAFADGQTAKDAEDEMKAQFAKLFESLGGAFFLGDVNDLSSAAHCKADVGLRLTEHATARPKRRSF